MRIGLRTPYERLRRLLAPPRFADPDTDRIARTAYTCALAIMGIVGLWTLGALLIERERERELVVAISVYSLAVPLLVAALARSGHARLSAAVLVFQIYVIACVGLWLEGGLPITTIGAFVMVVLAASLFFRARVAWAMAGLVVVTLGVFGELAADGLISPSSESHANRVLLSAFVTVALVVLLVQMNLSRITASQRFLREITDATPHALFVFDLVEQKTSYGNRAARVLLSDEGSFLSEPETLRRVVHPDDLPVVAEHGARLRDVGDDELLDVEYRVQRADGQHRTLRAQTRVFDRTADGRVRQILGVAEDVTAEREARRNLDRSRERLRRAERLEALGRLAGGIAHDFNNFLTVIIGATESAEREIGGDEVLLRELIGDAKAAAQHSAELTRQLLGFSRQRLTQPRTLQLNDLLRESDRLLRRVIPSNIEIAFLLGDDLPPIHADPSQVEQLVLNLAVNARDAMPGGGSITIETSSVEVDADMAALAADAQIGPHVLLSVADTGAGMDEETRAKIFEPLFTTKGSGTGFGLATVDAIVRAAGGHLHVESRPGHGTRFDVYLPRADGEVEPMARPEESRDLRGTERILLVEDDPHVRALARRVLERSGYVVSEAADGEAGRRIFLERPDEFDAVLTDVMMPGLSGLDMAASLREYRPDLPIVFMSGYAADLASDRGIGAKDHLLHKPFTALDLERRMRDALDAR